MLVANKKTLKADINGLLRDAFIGLCVQKNISQVDALEAMLSFLLSLDDLSQSMFMGQTTPDRDLVEWALKRIAGQKPREVLTAVVNGLQKNPYAGSPKRALRREKPARADQP